MISNMSDRNTSNLVHIRTNDTDNKEIWSMMADLSTSHRLLFDFFNLLQERIIHLEKVAHSSAVYPRSMQ